MDTLRRASIALCQYLGMAGTRVLVLVAVGVLTMSGCGAQPEVAAEDPAPVSAAEELSRFTSAIADVSSVERVVRLTPENDPDQMLGEDPGYEAAAVIHDGSLRCRGADVDCGALVEVWPDEGGAQFRVEEQDAFVAVDVEMGMGIHRTAGRVVLFVSADLPKTTREAYFAAFDEAAQSQ